MQNTGKTTMGYVVAALGMACYWPLLRRNVLFYVLGGHDATPFMTTALYCLYLLAVVALTVFAVRVSGRGGSRADVLARPLTVLFVAQAVIKFIASGQVLGGVAGGIVGAIDVSLFAAVFVLLCLLWARHVCSMSREAGILVSVGGFVASFFVQQLMWLPDVAARLCAVALPLLSFFALLYSAKSLQLVDTGDAARVSKEQGRTWRPGRTAVVLMVLLLVSGVLRGIVNAGIDGALTSPPLRQDVLSIAYAGLLLVCCVVFAGRPRLLAVAWSLTVVVLFAGVLVMAFFGDAGVTLGSDIMIMGRTCLGLLLWITLADEVRDNASSATLVFGTCFISCDVLSSLLGYLVIPAIAQAAGVEVASIVPVLATATAFLMMLASVFSFSLPLFGMRGDAFGQRDGGLEGPSGDEAMTDAGARLDEVAALYKLTEKESQVAGLLAAGNSQKRIAEVLGVTVGTVQTHLKSIYRKLDIHSRQELIDVVHGNPVVLERNDGLWE